jgi:hypothetical protein
MDAILLSPWLWALLSRASRHAVKQAAAECDRHAGIAGSSTHTFGPQDSTLKKFEKLKDS